MSVWSAGDDPVNETYCSTLDLYDPSSNSTCKVETAPEFTNRSLIKVLVLTVMAVCSILGNAVTILSIAREKKPRSSTLYTLLLQLAIADLLVSVWCIAGEAAWTFTVQWRAGTLFCKIFKFFQVFSLYLSTFVMVVIGLDRLRAVRHPMRRVSSSSHSCLQPVVIIWILSSVLAAPQLAIFRVVRGPFTEEFYQCVTYGFYTAAWQEQTYTIFSLLTMFVIPLIALITSYIIIFCTIAEKERSFRASSFSGCRFQQPVRENLQRDHQTAFNRREHLLRRAKFKTLKISVIIVSVFIICWTPYYVMMIAFIFLEPSEEMVQDLLSAIFFFGMSNSLLNPLIYGAFHLWRPGHKLLGSYSSDQAEPLRIGMRQMQPTLPARSSALHNERDNCTRNGTVHHSHGADRHAKHLMCSVHFRHKPIIHT